MTFDRLLVTCEHGGNRVPVAYAECFRGRRARAALDSHRGYDPGALTAARRLARRLDAPLVACTVTRLLVEVNRSVGHPRLYSEFSRRLPAAERRRLLARHYTPHRTAVEAAIARALGRHHRLLHLAMHSFTPRLAGATRRADLGLLYDPARAGERRLCAGWVRLLRADPMLRVRRNYPYRGDADGLVTHLRRRFHGSRYAAVEIELNQALLVGPGRTRAAGVVRRLADTLVALPALAA